MTAPPVTPALPEHVDLRLVVTDMDGTLLDGSGHAPPGLERTMERMGAHGVVLVPASGRQLANIRAVLGPVAQDSPFIAENGSYVVQGDEEIHSDTIAAAQVRTAVTTTRELAAAGQDIGAVVATKHRAYIDRGDRRFVNECVHYYSELEVVDDLLALPLDEVLKVAVYSFGDIEREAAPTLAAAVPQVQTVVSGAHWTDMMSPRASKGRALEALQRRLGVTPDQTAVFGDYLNDLELYEHSSLSFAMGNAHPQVLARARYTAPANTDHGVLSTVEALLDRMA
ncbi:MAG: HAD family hydrolase [Actinomyces sp.]|uniref:HAD family hydrolase n=1 Tax=Actinomyces sp. TaxID=29317 RepID=UPI0026DCCDD9|nr:HAD family hydrolase [Actinomyces sp.]MDO4243335.1 HAD family hydrolase [Actinomyces sp.]